MRIEDQNFKLHNLETHIGQHGFPPSGWGSCPSKLIIKLTFIASGDPWVRNPNGCGIVRTCPTVCYKMMPCHAMYRAGHRRMSRRRFFSHTSLALACIYIDGTWPLTNGWKVIATGFNTKFQNLQNVKCRKDCTWSNRLVEGIEHTGRRSVNPSGRCAHCHTLDEQRQSSYVSSHSQSPSYELLLLAPFKHLRAATCIRPTTSTNLPMVTLNVIV